MDEYKKMQATASNVALLRQYNLMVIISFLKEKSMKKIKLLAVSLFLILAIGCSLKINETTATSDVTVQSRTVTSDPTLIWSDEFDGTELDLTKWEPQIGDGSDYGVPSGWGNNEEQYYKAENAVVSNGILSIVAKKERVQAFAYTSARLRTRNLADFTYGRFEASIKLPAGAGLWPAFWMLSTNEPYGGWPQSGEIDIMEYLGHTTDQVFGTIHYGPLWPDNQHQGNNFYLYDGSQFSDGFHEYAVEWEAGEIRWYVDDILFSTKTEADVAPNNWPFDHDFHILLNLAVGGNLGGTVDASVFPQSMDVDYVRVYDSPKPTIRGTRVVNNSAAGVVFNVDKLDSSVNVSWSVPSDATIVSGQGTSEVVVDFGSVSGDVVATFDAGLGTESLTIDVIVEPSYSKEFSFENFDESGSVSLDTASTTGTLTEVANPSSDAVNSSVIVGEYVRDSAEQYDTIFYSTSAIQDATQYSKVGANKKFFMDIYTNAPIGTEVIVQLEDSTSTSTNWPAGRHSRYNAIITENGNWQRLEFSYFDAPDPAASSTISKIVVLFNSNSLTGDTYYFDNFDSYNAGTGGTTNEAPTVSISNPTNGSSFAEGSAITVDADASDSDGSVTQVEFFADGVSIGIDTLSPYSINWTVPAGSTTLTAVATDDAAATTTSASVSVTGTTESGTATYMYVSSVVTGSVTSKGKNKGTATVTILDDLGNAVSGATVYGTFSGTFNETASGVTGSDGTVILQTASGVRGEIVVNFTVDDVTGDLIYDSSLNTN